MIKYFLHNKLVSFILLFAIILWGLAVMPFNWQNTWFPRNAVAVDAIPDIGENQQIVVTEWMGRSPQDVDNQITYPLTTALQGIPGVKAVRSTSMFGMSFIYIIFSDNIDFYWSRTRILEKLNSLPGNMLPQGVKPTLGPDATALGQVYWYTLQAINPKTGEITTGWDLHELRSVQDFLVKNALLSTEGVAEVSSVGGHVKEYQVDVDPNAMKAYNVSLMQVMEAVRNSNKDIGAQTIELNRVEYAIRGIGYIKSIADIENSFVAMNADVPVCIKDIAHVTIGPAAKRGGIDNAGVESVGGVVVARYGANPMEVINNLKLKINEISKSLPSKTLANGTVSKVSIVPFYDRSILINETLGTLQSALMHEILICIIVIIVLLVNLRASVLVSALLPLAVLITFIAMKCFGVEANIVALSGIAIAIGVVADVGIIIVENILRHLKLPQNKNINNTERLNIVYTATTEVSGAITTALATTIISFLPVFFMQGAEGKLFKPLAYTKTFALVASIIIGLVIVPVVAYLLFSIKTNWLYKKTKKNANEANRWLSKTERFLSKANRWFSGAETNAEQGLSKVGTETETTNANKHITTFALQSVLFFKNTFNYIIKSKLAIVLAVVLALYLLSTEWLPMGASVGIVVNFAFVSGLILFILGILWLMVRYYEPILLWCLLNKRKFLLIPLFTILFGLMVFLGVGRIFYYPVKIIDKTGYILSKSTGWQWFTSILPGLGREFMPSLNEGSFLLMPSTMPHAGVEENMEVISNIDQRISKIPEIDNVVGKWGRANSALDPAPISMFENIVNYKPEYVLDANGHRMRFEVNGKGNFKLKNGTCFNIHTQNLNELNINLLIPNKHGEYFRQWRPHIKSANDIWNEIINVATYPGLTSSPKLQPIETRLVMLSTGMRAPMGIKVLGNNLDTVEKFSIALEQVLKNVPGVEATSVFAERNLGVPYIEIQLNRTEMARYGLTVTNVHDAIEVAIGGMPLTTTFEGRENYNVRVRYPRQLRDKPNNLGNILLMAYNGSQIPLNMVATINYKPGPQMVRTENTFLTNYVIFDKKLHMAEVDVVEQARNSIQKYLNEGKIVLPNGVNYVFAGNYQQQARATKQLAIVIPISLAIIFLILFFQFKTVTASCIHFSGVFVAFAGGFIMLWLYAQPWFLNFSIGSTHIGQLFQVHPINLSVAVWVGFIALFGIATNDGVIMGTYIHQVFEQQKPATRQQVREAVIMAGKKRVRPAMMTAAIAIIALLPVLTSSGKGADIMVPMAIPTFGGMVIQIMTMFIVPVLQSVWRENKIKTKL